MWLMLLIMWLLSLIMWLMLLIMWLLSLIMWLVADHVTSVTDHVTHAADHVTSVTDHMTCCWSCDSCCWLCYCRDRSRVGFVVVQGWAKARRCVIKHLWLVNKFSLNDTTGWFSQIKIEVLTTLPVQVDGEAWPQPPGVISIKRLPEQVKWQLQLHI